jgi:predicted transposase YbfD/YdcC
MEVDASRGPLRFFAHMPDPRAANRRHLLFDMMVIALLAVLSKANDWIDIVAWARAHEPWLRTFLKLPHGIPSHDTFGRLFAKLSPQALEHVFVTWTSHLSTASAGKLIALDGKSLRRSFDQASGKTAIHMISAWSHENRLVLGQMAVDGDSNEITAMPKLLELLDLKGALVTIDAIGCQTAIAETIVKKKADYLLAVKQNQKELHEDITFFFEEALAQGFDGVRHGVCETVDGDHGRVETRRGFVTDDIAWLRQRHPHWPKLAAIVCVESVRHVTGKAEPSPTRRYYITSRRTDASAMLAAARGHWGIENPLHWSLDVTFREDENRSRKGHAPENLSRVRRLALNMLRRDTSMPKTSLKTKRFLCGCDRQRLLTVLQGP